jgi:hypothetical protein
MKGSRKRACKPDSVQWPCGQSDNHSSRLNIAAQLKPPTRALGERRWRTKRLRAYLVLLQVGFT